MVMGSILFTADYHLINYGTKHITINICINYAASGLVLCYVK